MNSGPINPITPVAGIENITASAAWALVTQKPTCFTCLAIAGMSPSARLWVMTGPRIGSNEDLSFCGTDATCCAM